MMNVFDLSVIHGGRVHICGYQGQGEEEMGSIAYWVWGFLWGNEKVLKLDSTGGFTTLWCTKGHRVVHFKMIIFMLY